jgi:hypothetical protein
MKTKSIKNVFTIALSRWLFGLTILFAIFTMVACGRYEEGPCISFRSVKSRLEGQYIVTYFEKNNQDVLPEWKEKYDWKISFGNDRESEEYNFFINGKYLIDSNFVYPTQPGNYDLPVGKSEISFWFYKPSHLYPEYGLYPFVQNQTIVVQITRLTNNELWITHESGNDFYEIHLEK